MQYRHGDVFLTQVESLPTGEAKEREGLVLVHGEATGHAHRMSDGRILDYPDGTAFLVLTGPATLTHEEHATLVIPVGIWMVTRQREYAPVSRGWQFVED